MKSFQSKHFRVITIRKDFGLNVNSDKCMYGCKTNLEDGKWESYHEIKSVNLNLRRKVTTNGSIKGVTE